MTKHRDIILVLAGLIAIVIAIIAITGRSPETANQVFSPLTAVATASDHVKGNPEATLTLVEYSDFQCPACAAYYPMLKQLTSDFSEEVKFVYRHFPLRQSHRNAEAAARAAVAAARQDRFWPMHDLLFENQARWAETRLAKDEFIEYASTLGLNLDQFRADLDSDETKRQVQDDYASGLKSDVKGTPTFFLNGQKLINPQSYDDFRNLILQALAGQA